MSALTVTTPLACDHCGAPMPYGPHESLVLPGATYDMCSAERADLMYEAGAQYDDEPTT